MSVSEKLAVKLAEIATRIGNNKVRVGFLESATYSDGTPVAAVAWWNEVGSGAGVPEGMQSNEDFDIPDTGAARPPRPFFHNAIDKYQGGWGNQLAVALKSTDGNGDRALNMMGAVMAGQIQQSIIDLKEPGNAPSTIERKGFDDPLIDTGTMLRSVDWEVKK